MTTQAKKKTALSLWQEKYPDYMSWKNFILKRHGPLISGICLDSQRDPKVYTPIFFIHNLISDFSTLTLSYATAPMKRGVEMQISYESEIETIDEILRENAHPLKNNLSFESYLDHIKLSHSKKIGYGLPYLPATIFDIITVGCYLGLSDYFMSTIDAAKKKINETPGINKNIIGDPEKWANKVRHSCACSNGVEVQESIERIKLPSGLRDYGLSSTICEIDYLSWL